jgi:capsular exopolysaccharide synthesis family protein
MEKIQDAIAKARAARPVEGPAAAAAPVATLVQPENGHVVVQDQIDLPTAAGPASTPTPAPTRAQIAAAWTDLPQIAPSAGKLRRQRIMTFAGGPEATHFDVMRTRLLQQLRANGWRRVGVTSPDSGCGKSTLVLNLAFSLARQMDQRTLVLDVDLRKPSLARTLGITDSADFAAVLDGSATFAACARRFGQNLAFATNHRPASRPSELLQSAGAARVLDEMQVLYDPTVILFDMPPMQAGDDAMAFAARVDCVLIVAAAEQTTIKQIDTCERELAGQTNVLGVVLNKCRYLRKDDSYGYY